MSTTSSRIVPIQRFTHPLADPNETYGTKKEADAAHRRALKEQKRTVAKQQAEEKRRANCDYLRLNATSIEHIEQLWAELLLKHTGITSTLKLSNVRFGELACTHDCPVGGKTGGWHGDVAPRALGWRASANGSWKLPKGFKSKAPFGDCVFAVVGHGDIQGFHFRGISSGGGNGGDPFSFTVRFYLDDFPKLKAAYNRYIMGEAERKAHAIKREAAAQVSIAAALETEEARSLAKDQAIAQQEVDRLTELLALAHKEHNRATGLLTTYVNNRAATEAPQPSYEVSEADWTAMQGLFYKSAGW